MKKTLVLTTIALLVSGSAVAKTWVLTNAEEGMDKGNWQINSDQLKVKDHAFSIEQKVLHGGKQGYVTGIEPGTSYAYPVTIEREQKRVKQLQPGASAQFDLTYTLLHDSAQVAAVEQKIAKIQGDNKVAENETPIAKE